MDPHPTRQPRDEDTPAETTAEEERAAEDGLLLEFPLQEHHHRIISTFMAEHRHNSSPDGPGTGIGRLMNWWLRRKAPS